MWFTKNNESGCLYFSAINSPIFVSIIYLILFLEHHRQSILRKAAKNSNQRDSFGNGTLEDCRLWGMCHRNSSKTNKFDYHQAGKQYFGTPNPKDCRALGSCHETSSKTIDPTGVIAGIYKIKNISIGIQKKDPSRSHLVDENTNSTSARDIPLAEGEHGWRIHRKGKNLKDKIKVPETLKENKSKKDLIRDETAQDKTHMHKRKHNSNKPTIAQPDDYGENKVRRRHKQKTNNKGKDSSNTENYPKTSASRKRRKKHKGRLLTVCLYSFKF